MSTLTVNGDYTWYSKRYILKSKNINIIETSYGLEMQSKLLFKSWHSQMLMQEICGHKEVYIDSISN